MMFRKIRRIQNELSPEAGKTLLRQNKRAALSVNGDDGYPYTIPINFYYAEEENRIYFHSGKAGYKIDAIRANGKVCFTTWDEGYRTEDDWAFYVSSCVAFGRAVFITDPEIAVDRLRKFALKYYPSAREVEEQIQKGLGDVQVIAIEIEHLSAKKVHEK